VAAVRSLLLLLAWGFSSSLLAADKLNFDAYSVYSPLGAGWMVSRGGVYDVAFGAALTRTHTWAMTAAAVPLRFPVDESFAQRIRDAFVRDSDTARFRIVEAQADAQTLNGATCARLRVKAEEAAQFIIEATQVTCAHPSAPGLAIELGYHERYLPGEESGRFNETGERFIRSARFWRPVPAAQARSAADVMPR